MKTPLLLIAALLLLGVQEGFEELTEAIDQFIPALADKLELLIALFLWTLPAQYLVGFLPQEAPLLYVAQFFNPWTVTGVVLGALLISEVANYQTVKAIGNIPQIHGLLRRPGVHKPIEWFRKAPFTAISVAAFTPIPFFPLRLLAPLSGYPLPKYIGAVVIGRAPRIYLLALLGLTFQFPIWFLVLIAITPIVIVGWRLSIGDQTNPVLTTQTAIFKKLPVIMTIPNIMTTSRLVIFLPLFVYGLNIGDTTVALLGIILIGVTDLFDGVVARIVHQETEFGKFFDYATDILCWLVIGFSLAFTTDLPVGFVYFLLSREILHISFAAHLSGKGVVTKSSRVATISGALTVATFIMYLLMLPYKEVMLIITILAMLNGSIHYFRIYTLGLKAAKEKKVSE